ncbi:MAG TPA: hypothetical protein VFQ52_03235, partial [Rhizomicrobium sp.]|nr:hypothetical protein [Rhizomicrobium sp.]
MQQIANQATGPTSKLREGNIFLLPDADSGLSAVCPQCCQHVGKIFYKKLAIGIDQQNPIALGCRNGRVQCRRRALVAGKMQW